MAKGLFASKRGRPDMQPAMAGSCTQVQMLNEGDWIKLANMMKCLNGTRELVLALSDKNLKCIKWHVDAVFAVHPDCESHTGVMITMCKGGVTNISRKQKLNTRSSTTAELVAADDAVVIALWTKSFLEAQGYGIHKNISCQDNQSTISLEENGKRSSSDRARHLNICCILPCQPSQKKDHLN